ncbi:MAG: transglycosylase SLT domain-containing protein [Pseudomonadota bacterium]
MREYYFAVAVALGGLLIGQAGWANPAVKLSGPGPETALVAPAPRPGPPVVGPAGPETTRPVPREPDLPRARWERLTDGGLWTRVAVSAVRTHGAPLLNTVPDDISEWCPAYPGHGEPERAAFWMALLSSLARYESTFDARAVGGGGRWFGLMQIYPPTAEFRGCRAQSGGELRHGPSNLSCAVRIMAITVPRDNAIAMKGTERWRGVAADWGPIRNDWKRRDMQAYTRRQVYCRPLSDARPRARPGDFIADSE